MPELRSDDPRTTGCGYGSCGRLLVQPEPLREPNRLGNGGAGVQVNTDIRRPTASYRSDVAHPRGVRQWWRYRCDVGHQAPAARLWPYGGTRLPGRSGARVQVPSFDHPAGGTAPDVPSHRRWDREDSFTGPKSCLGSIAARVGAPRVVRTAARARTGRSSGERHPAGSEGQRPASLWLAPWRPLDRAEKDGIGQRDHRVRRGGSRLRAADLRPDVPRAARCRRP